MFELFKILIDALVLGDSARKGMLTVPVCLAGAGFAVLEYAIFLPAVMYYDKHPQAKPLFIAAMVLVAINFVVFMAWALRWYLRRLAVRRTASQPN